MALVIVVLAAKGNNHMRLYAHTSTEDLVRAALTMESVLAGDPLDKRVG